MMKTEHKQTSETASVTPESQRKHPLRPGTVVNIFNTSVSGKPILEGRATIQSATNIVGRYNVRFHDDPPKMTYERSVQLENVIEA